MVDPGAARVATLEIVPSGRSIVPGLESRPVDDKYRVFILRLPSPDVVAGEPVAAGALGFGGVGASDADNLLWWYIKFSPVGS